MEDRDSRMYRPLVTSNSSGWLISYASDGTDSPASWMSLTRKGAASCSTGPHQSMVSEKKKAALRRTALYGSRTDTQRVAGAQA